MTSLCFCDRAGTKTVFKSNLNLTLKEEIEVLRSGGTCRRDLLFELGAVE